MPSKNGANTLDRVLQAVYTQTTLLSYEVIVVDSGSTDSTLEILSKYPVRLFQIAPAEFSHSRTRNYGASLARAASYLVFLNQDAVPADEQWLENLVKSLEQEPGLKAVCAMELNEKKKFFNVAGVASYLFVNSRVKGLYVIEPYLLANSADMSKLEQRQLFPFTTVCAIFEKSHFLLHPFNEKVRWAEDLHWAVDNSNLGYRSACTSLAKVFHFHDYTARELSAIMEHTREVYMEVFGWEDVPLNTFVAAVNPGPAPVVSLPQIDEVLNSWSWKITAPLRKVHAFLIKLKLQ